MVWLLWTSRELSFVHMDQDCFIVLAPTNIHTPICPCETPLKKYKVSMEKWIKSWFYHLVTFLISRQPLKNFSPKRIKRHFCKSIWQPNILSRTRGLTVPNRERREGLMTHGKGKIVSHLNYSFTYTIFLRRLILSISASSWSTVVSCRHIGIGYYGEIP